MPLAYGFHDLEHLAEERVQEIGISETNERITLWNAEVNRVFDAIFGVFTTRNEEWNTKPIIKYYQPSTSRAQFVDEHGVAQPRIEKGSYQIGLPLLRYEDAFAQSYEAMKKMKLGELSRELDRIERADMSASIFLFLFACFYDENWTFVSTEANLPNIPVKALANGDADEYIIRGTDAPATASHYLGQADAIDDDHDPFPTIKDGLTQYAGSGPNDRIVSFVGDTTNAAAIKALSGFHRVDRTKFTSWGDNVSLVDQSADTFIGMGDEVLGEHEEGVLVVRWRSLPDNYLLNFNLDAPAPIGIREDEVTDLRGLFNIDAVENSGNMLLRRFRRKIGFAPVNRTGASVMEIGDASYDPPTQYENIPG